MYVIIPGKKSDEKVNLRTNFVNITNTPKVRT